MRNAYIIIAHNNYCQLSKLVAQLDYPGNDLYIHINADVELPDYSRMRSTMKHSELVVLPRNKMCWGTYGLLKSMIAGLREATKNGPYDYYHVLSGIDIPLKSNSYINEFLQKNLYKNRSKGKYKTNYLYIDKHFRPKDIAFAAHYNLLVPLWRHPNAIIRYLSHRINDVGYYVQQILHVNRLRSSLPYDRIAKGSSWWSITDSFAKYILSKSDWIEQNFGHYTFAADEIAIQTIAYNSVYSDSLYVCEEGENMNMRCIDWKRGRPYVFRTDDYDELIHSKYLFARKVDEQIDSNIIDRIYEYLQGEEI